MALKLPSNNGDIPNLTLPENKPIKIKTITGIYLKNEIFGDVTTDKYHTQINLLINPTTNNDKSNLYYDGNANFNMLTYPTNNNTSGPTGMVDIGISSFVTNDFRVLSVLNFPNNDNYNKYRYFMIDISYDAVNSMTLWYKVVSITPNSISAKTTGASKDYVATFDPYQSFAKYLEPTLLNTTVTPERATGIINPYIMENYSVGENATSEVYSTNYFVLPTHMQNHLIPTQYINNGLAISARAKRNVFASKKFNMSSVAHNNGRTGVLRLIAGTTSTSKTDRDTNINLKPLPLYNHSNLHEDEATVLWNQKLSSLGEIYLDTSLEYKDFWDTTIVDFTTNPTGKPQLNYSNNMSYKSSMKCAVVVINDKFYAFPLGMFTLNLKWKRTITSIYNEQYYVFNDPEDIEHIVSNPSTIKNIVFPLNPNGADANEGTSSNIVDTYIQQTTGKQYLKSPVSNPSFYEILSFNVLSEGFLGYYDVPVDLDYNFAPLTFIEKTENNINWYFKSLIGYEISTDALTTFGGYSNEKYQVKKVSYIDTKAIYRYNSRYFDIITSNQNNTNNFEYTNSLYYYALGDTFSELHIPRHLLPQVNPVFIDRIYLTMYDNYSNKLKILAPVERAVEPNYNKLQAQISNQINYDNSVNNLVQQQNLSKRSLALGKQQADFNHAMGITSSVAGAVSGIAGSFGQAASGNLVGAIGGSVSSLFNLGVNIANNEQAYHVANIQRGIAEDTLKNQMAENARNNETTKKQIALNNKFTPTTQVEESVKHLINPYLSSYNYTNFFGWINEHKNADTYNNNIYYLHRLNNGYPTNGYNPRLRVYMLKDYNGNQSELNHFYLAREYWLTNLTTLTNITTNNKFLLQHLYEDILNFCIDGWASGLKVWNDIDTTATIHLNQF